jgi:hypothetical protein
MTLPFRAARHTEFATIYQELLSSNPVLNLRGRSRILVLSPADVRNYHEYARRRTRIRIVSPYAAAVGALAADYLFSVLTGHTLHAAAGAVCVWAPIKALSVWIRDQKASTLESSLSRDPHAVNLLRILAIQTDDAEIRGDLLPIVTAILQGLTPEECRHLSGPVRSVLKGWLEGRHRYPALESDAAAQLDLAVMRVAPLTEDLAFIKGLRKRVRRGTYIPSDPRHWAASDALSKLIALRASRHERASTEAAKK